MWLLSHSLSDLSKSKRRPAIVVANITGINIILCQITSQKPRSKYAVEFEVGDVRNNDGSIKQKSYIQPNIIFTADSRIVVHKAGDLSKSKMKSVTNMLVNIFEGKI
ncbi:MAG: type II toxin-antitoxin system PemK/MazF family toxin [Anaerolineae bacterium]|nr:type II toxin-antitoxin system PemK/MazF family toxin [Anaerolineae bacterium]